MRILRPQLTLLCLLAFGTACENNAGPKEESDLLYLYQEWNHSYEEEADGATTDVLRAASADAFPVSWFRKRYIFSPDGTVEWLELSAVDQHYMRSGFWKADAADPSIINIYDSSRSEIKLLSFQILNLKPDFMEIMPYTRIY